MDNQMGGKLFGNICVGVGNLCICTDLIFTGWPKFMHQSVIIYPVMGLSLNRNKSVTGHKSWFNYHAAQILYKGPGFDLTNSFQFLFSSKHKCPVTDE